MTTATDSATTDKSVTTQVYRVYIKATPQAVWDAITKPEFAAKYGYGGRMELDLKPGGAYKGYASDLMKSYGAPDLVVVGDVIESNPPNRLVLTWHPIWDPQTSAEPATRLTYEIEEEMGLVRLTLTHDVTGAPYIAKQVSGEIPNAGGGWPFVLSDIKSLLETGKAMVAA